jgi:hypothetical protein
MKIYHKLARKGFRLFEECRIVNDLGSGEVGRSQNPNDYLGQKAGDTEWYCTEADIMFFTFRRKLTIKNFLKYLTGNI